MKKASFDIGHRIADLLTENGKNQSDLARFLKIGPSAISQWISGGTSPTYDRLGEIARFFRLSVPELLGGPAEKDSPSMIITAESDDVKEIPAGSSVRVDLGQHAEVGDIVLYKEETANEYRFLRLAAYKNGISVLMSDKTPTAPIISADYEHEIIGPATEIILKKAKKETAPAGKQETASEDIDTTSQTNYTAESGGCQR